MQFRPFVLLSSIFLVVSTLTLSGQVPFTSDLYKEIMHCDSIVFEMGYNQCQLDALANVVADDLELYHDITGAMIGKDVFLAAIQQNICSHSDRKPIRKLTPNSVTVFPLYQNGKIYGAVQHGEHGFGLQQPDGTSTINSKARFTHLWMLEEAHGWRLKRVMSYDHQR